MSKISTLRFYKLSLYLLLIIFIFRTNPALAQTSSCQPIERAVYNAKSTNTNLFDDIGVIMTKVLNDNSETGWLFEAGTTFTENNDGSANLKGTIKQFGDYTQVRRFAVDLTLKGQTFTPPPGSPFNKTNVPTEGWYYYTSIEGTFTGLDGIAGGKLGIVLHMKAFQAGIGANQLQDEILDQTANGGSGWFEWTVLNQPTTGILFNDYISGTTIADIAMIFEGTPSVPCCTASAGSVSIATTEYTLSNNQALIKGTLSLNSQVPVGYRIGYVLTYGDNKIIKDIKSTPQFTVSDTGKYCIHAMVYNPGTLDLRGIKNDTTEASEIASMLRENGGDICASLNLEGTCVTVKTNPCDIDDVSPVLTNCPKNITVSTNSHCGVASWTPPTATDNCDVAALSFITAPVAGWKNGDCFPIGTTTVTYTATDLKGNKVSCNFDIIVISTCDNVKDAGLFEKKCINGAIVLQNTVNPSGGTGTVEYQWMKSIYGCPDSMHHAIAGATNESLNVGSVSQTTYFVRCSRIMGCNNWVGETICMTVNPDDCNPCTDDKTPPTLSRCPADISLTTTGTCAVATWVAPTATDNCGTPSVILTSSPTTGLGIDSCFPVGTTIMTYTATDNKGNKTTCSFKVVVIKTGCIGDQTYCDNNNNGKYDAGDAPATNLTITLCDANFGTITTQAVDANGKYKFTNLVAGTYWVKFPTATLDGKPLTTASPIKVVLAEGQNFLDADAGYYKPANKCGNILSICSVLNTIDNCGNATKKPYVALFNNIWYTAGNDLTFTEYADGTALLKGSVINAGVAYHVNVNFSGKATASSGSPKLELCAINKTNGAGWYYYTTTTGTFQTAKGTYSITRRGPAFQIGQFANLQENKYGASGWFTANNNCVGDFNINLGDELPCNSVAPPTACSTQKGYLLREYWLNHTNWTFPTVLPNAAPNGSDLLDQLCFIPKNQNWKDNYASRTSGYLTAPCSGNYYFNVTGDDYTEFYISTDGKASGKKLIAFVKGWTNTDELNKYSSQNSKAVYLEKGKKYYIEVITKEGNGGDHFAIRWKRPYQNCWSVITNQYLSSPCIPTALAQLAQVREDKIDLMATPELRRTRLEWISNMGDMNDYFTVQKMNEQGEFMDLETINGSFNEEIKYFTSYDNNITEGDNFYRIKSQLMNGSVKYSETQTVNFMELENIKVFPNPAAEYAEIDLSSYEGSAVKVSIFNAWGQSVLSYTIDNATAQPYRMDVNSLKSGNFIIYITSSGKRQVNKRLTISK